MKYESMNYESMKYEVWGMKYEVWKYEVWKLWSMNVGSYFSERSKVEIFNTLGETQV